MKKEEVKKENTNKENASKKNNTYKANDFKSTWIKLLKYISEYKGKTISVIILTIASSVITIIAPKIAGQAVTLLSNGTMQKISGAGMGIDLDSIFNILTILFFMYTVMAFASCISSYIMTDVSVDITYKLRQKISKKINVLKISYFDDVNYGEVLSCIANDVDILSSTLTQSICQIISSVIMLFGILYMMFSISWEMTLISLGFCHCRL